MRPLYSSNFDKTLLLCNLPIEVYFNNFESPISIELPQMKDLIYNNDINIFIELLTNEQQWSNNGIFIAKNKMQMILATNKTIQNSTIPQTFKKFFPNLRIEKNKIMFEDIEINEEQFDLLFDMFLVGCHRLDFDEFDKEKKSNAIQQDNEIAEFLKRQKELEEKIHKSKADSKKFELDKTVICILSYFPQYKIEDLIKMNPYTFFTLYEWSLKREYQFVHDVAAGNGLMAKENKYQPLF